MAEIVEKVDKLEKKVTRFAKALGNYDTPFLTMIVNNNHLSRWILLLNYDRVSLLSEEKHNSGSCYVYVIYISF